MQVIKDASLKDVLWYKIGGTTRFLLVCESREDIIQAVEFIQKEKISKYVFVGLGSNLLFTDEYFDGAVVQIKPGKEPQIKEVKGEVIEAYAGEELDSVIQFSFENNLTGLEWAGGLPGTVGAGVRGNVGAFGGEISKSFAGAEILEIQKTGYKIHGANRRDIKFAYRNSTIKKMKNLIVLSAFFKLEKSDDAKVGRARTTYYANIEYRKNKHPLEYPSTGSAFKNISKTEDVKKVLEVFPDIENDVKIKWHGKVSVGYLIKRLDLSGFQVGGAQISNKHSNFIVNLGSASFTDVLTIINKIQSEFLDNFGFSPEPEVEIIE